MAEGLVVAGGYSTRFGDRDKAVADLAGTPMIRRVADGLVGVIEALVVNCRTEQVPAVRAAMDGYDREVRYAEDPDPGRGPMAGIRTGLGAVGSEYAVVVACDVPFLDPGLVEYLLERASGRDAAVPLVDGRLQPVGAVYRVDPTVRACQRALDRGDRRVTAPLEDLDYVVVREAELRSRGDPRSFENLNTREAFEAAARRLS